MNPIQKWIYFQILLRLEARAEGVSYGWLSTVERIKLNLEQTKKGH